VVGPKRLRDAIQFDGFKWLATGMTGGEAQVSRRMPVLGCGHQRILRDQFVEDRNDRVAAGYRQASAGKEINLHIHENESFHEASSFRVWSSSLSRNPRRPNSLRARVPAACR
jgi:hypothetical protein